MSSWDRSPGRLLELEQDPQLAYLVRNWDFSEGRRFQAKVLSKFQSAVHHTSSSPEGSFYLLAVFHRYTFRLTTESVSLALHCCLGGTPSGFHVEFAQDRHFRFSVANKHVGLAVRELKRITTDHFDVYFHLWRDGCDRWEWEKKKFEEEEKASWTYVSYRKEKAANTRSASKRSANKKVHFAEKIVQESPVKKSVPQELHQGIKIGNFFCPLSINTPLQKATSSEDEAGARTSCCKRPSASVRPNPTEAPANDRHSHARQSSSNAQAKMKNRRVSDQEHTVQMRKVFQRIKENLRIHPSIDRVHRQEPIADARRFGSSALATG